MNKSLLKIGILSLLLSAPFLGKAYDFELNGVYYDITNASSLEVSVTHDYIGLGSIGGSSSNPNKVHSGSHVKCHWLGMIKIGDLAIGQGKMKFKTERGLFHASALAHKIRNNIKVKKYYRRLNY